MLVVGFIVKEECLFWLEKFQKGNDSHILMKVESCEVYKENSWA